jgi:hypothetical protein
VSSWYVIVVGNIRLNVYKIYMQHCCRLCEIADMTAKRMIEVMLAKTIFAQPVLRNVLWTQLRMNFGNVRICNEDLLSCYIGLLQFLYLFNQLTP